MGKIYGRHQKTDREKDFQIGKRKERNVIKVTKEREKEKNTNLNTTDRKCKNKDNE